MKCAGCGRPTERCLKANIQLGFCAACTRVVDQWSQINKIPHQFKTQSVAESRKKLCVGGCGVRIPSGTEISLLCLQDVLTRLWHMDVELSHNPFVERLCAPWIRRIAKWETDTQSSYTWGRQGIYHVYIMGGPELFLKFD